MSEDTLQSIPNVGPATAGDLRRLGVHRPEELEGRDARAMYDELCRLDGERHDPCVEDVFASAIHYVTTGESLHWAEFSRRRKARQEGS
jgi:hypothetical protein